MTLVHQICLPVLTLFSPQPPNWLASCISWTVFLGYVSSPSDQFPCGELPISKHSLSVLSCLCSLLQLFSSTSVHCGASLTVSLESLQLFTSPSPQAQYAYLDPEDTSASFPTFLPSVPLGQRAQSFQQAFAQSLR